MEDKGKRTFIGRIVFRKVDRVGRIKLPDNGRKIEVKNQS